MIETDCDVCNRPLSHGDFIICTHCEHKLIKQIRELQDRVGKLLEEIRRLKGEGFTADPHDKDDRPFNVSSFEKTGYHGS